jgi:hypothetical protein
MTGFRQCIVHAGTHKTGTTTVQNLMAAHRTELAAAGLHYPALEAKGRDHNALAHRLATCADDELPALRDALVSGARPGVATRLLLSAEELSTRIGFADAWSGFDDGRYWERRRHYLARLRSLLPQGADITVYLCFREHEAYAHALYATKLLSAKVDCSFGEFVVRCAPIFDYQRQTQVLAESLGPVQVQSYEHLRADLANRFFAWLALPIRVGQAPRLKRTPSLELIHWLAQAVPAATPDERRRRAEFCHAGVESSGGAAVTSLWSSQQQRQDFLGNCRPPPLADWPASAAAGAIADRDLLGQRMPQIEAEYQRWRARYGGRRKHWIYFWRRR